MLLVPDRGVPVSAKQHNNDLGTLCDWVELSALIVELELSRSDAIDVLLEQYRYAEQDLAAERIGSVWTEVRRRVRILGDASPLSIDDLFLGRIRPWEEAPAYTFCLAASLAPSYSGWVRQFGHDYTEQGELFERLTAAAVLQQMPDWQVRITGWSRGHAVSLADVAPSLAEFLGAQTHPRFGDYARDQAHESGLDLAAHRQFRDRRGARPVYLVQCASGADWWSKLHTPELAVWNKIIDFIHPPAKAFSMPFALEEGEFIKRGLQVNGLLLDRYRLLGLDRLETDWLDVDLAEDLQRWVGPRLEWLSATAAPM